MPVYRGREVTGIAQDHAGVDVAIADGQTMRAGCVVGCDGGRSVIRKAAGIDFPRWEPTMSCLLAQAEVGGDAKPPWGVRQGDLGVHSFSQVSDGGPVRMMITERRIIGGQGLNTGVQDAVNLGWKLARVVDGISPERLLDTYHSERHPVAARALRTTMAQLTLVAKPDDRIRALGEAIPSSAAGSAPCCGTVGRCCSISVHPCTLGWLAGTTGWRQLLRNAMVNGNFRSSVTSRRRQRCRSDRTGMSSGWQTARQATWKPR